MRLIDADTLKNYISINNVGCGCSEDYQKSFLSAVEDQPTVKPQSSRIEKELHELTPEAQYDFIVKLLKDFGMNYTDSRAACIKWLGGEIV